jgi:tripartite-type tricarboxylate transporter receptor subunit TctC
VRIIVPFQPGGSTDIFARLAAQKLTEHFGKQFYVENIAGATGNVGTAQAARAAADGHTLLIAFSSYVVNPTLFAKLPFDPTRTSSRSRSRSPRRTCSPSIRCCRRAISKSSSR